MDIQVEVETGMRLFSCLKKCHLTLNPSSVCVRVCLSQQQNSLLRLCHSLWKSRLWAAFCSLTSFNANCFSLPLCLLSEKQFPRTLDGGAGEHRSSSSCRSPLAEREFQSLLSTKISHPLIRTLCLFSFSVTWSIFTGELHLTSWWCVLTPQSIREPEGSWREEDPNVVWSVPD